MIYVCQVENIKWDTDGAEPPSDHWIVKVELDAEATEDDVSDAVSDKLSDDHGFCHKGFDMVIINRLVRTDIVISLTLSLDTKQSDPFEWDWHSLLDLGEDEVVEITG